MTGWEKPGCSRKSNFSYKKFWRALETGKEKWMKQEHVEKIKSYYDRTGEFKKNENIRGRIRPYIRKKAISTAGL